MFNLMWLTISCMPTIAIAAISGHWHALGQIAYCYACALLIHFMIAIQRGPGKYD